MLATAGLDEKTRTDLLARLKSIEGQARGIQRMLAEERDCQAIMEQMAALRAAAQAVSVEALEAFAMHCLHASSEPPEQVMTQVVAVVSKLTR